MSKTPEKSSESALLAEKMAQVATGSAYRQQRHRQQHHSDKFQYQPLLGNLPIARIRFPLQSEPSSKTFHCIVFNSYSF